SRSRCGTPGRASTRRSCPTRSNASARPRGERPARTVASELAIVRHLVEAHGGSVHAESPDPGQGAVFTVKLPLMAGTAGEAERRHPTAGVAGNGPLQRLDGVHP